MDKYKNFEKLIKSSIIKLLIDSKITDNVCELGFSKNFTAYNECNIKYLIGFDKGNTDTKRDIFEKYNVTYKSNFNSIDIFKASIKDYLVESSLLHQCHVVCFGRIKFAFKTKEHLHNYLRNISCALHPDGLFIGSTFDMRLIWIKLQKALEKHQDYISTKLYKLKLLTKQDQNGQPIVVGSKANDFGTFSLRINGISRHKYYFFRVERLIQEASKYGLELVQFENYETYFKNNESILPSLTSRVVSKDDLSPDVLELIRLYAIFVFRKKKLLSSS